MTFPILRATAVAVALVASGGMTSLALATPAPSHAAGACDAQAPQYRLGLVSPRLLSLNAALCAGGNTDAFWQEVGATGTPMIEAVTPDTITGDEMASPLAPPPGKVSLITFLWRGHPHNVRILGAPSGDHDDMHQLRDSDVWYRSYVVPESTRLSYQLAPNVPDIEGTPMERRRAVLKTVQADPLNRHPFTVEGFDGKRSVKSSVVLPDAPPQPWIERRADVPTGTLQATRFTSKALGNTRDVYVYRPAGYRADDASRGLLVVFDAHAYVNTVPTPVILDNLIAEGRIPPTAALIVGVIDGSTRGKELPPNPAFARFLSDELMPWAKAQGVSASADQTVVAGSSYGGLASAWAAHEAPQWFGNVLSQSGSYWWAPSQGDADARESGWLIRQYAEGPRLPVKFYLESGLFEDRRGPTGIGTSGRHMRDVLRAKGYRVTYTSTATGHDYLHWRGSLACGLMALIGTPDTQRALQARPAAPGSLAAACSMPSFGRTADGR
ncbi:enterochelin esterase domain-containing protein [Pandoraea sputorum]|uniref:enterochelin esterase domain-containing protein n=1 Tax=Pandoraea sputorum TaxID=93222 RepID=UPI001255E4C3|nr:alpha/beta hydrolase-fold protein [Pandoraea sputorum]VVD81099.1 esterase [Pandoraea sputorum]